MPDLQLTGGKTVCYRSANWANTAFHPFGVGKWVVINVFTWITGVETNKWRLWLRTAVCLPAKICDRWLGLRPRQYTDPVCELNEQYYLVNYVGILSVVWLLSAAHKQSCYYNHLGRAWTVQNRLRIERQTCRASSATGSWCEDVDESTELATSHAVGRDDEPFASDEPLSI